MTLGSLHMTAGDNHEPIDQLVVDTLKLVSDRITEEKICADCALPLLSAVLAKIGAETHRDGREGFLKAMDRALASVRVDPDQTH